MKLQLNEQIIKVLADLKEAIQILKELKTKILVWKIDKKK